MKRFKQLYNNCLIFLFGNKDKNIYKVEYVAKEYMFQTSYFYINILIKDLKLQFYRDYYTPSIKNDNFFVIGNYPTDLGAIPFSYMDIKSNKYYKIKYIEIPLQLQTLLYSKDELNRNLSTQIIFNKLGINNE